MNSQKTYVFLFGSSDFEDQTLTPIKNVEASLNQWEKLLLDENYFNLPSSNIQIHLNKSRDEVMSAFTRFCNQIPNGSLLLVYYAGHGVLDTNFSLFLSTPKSHVESIQWTGIFVNQFREEINRYKKISKIVILDCCFSAKFFEGIATTPQQLVETKILEMEQRKGLFMMASSGGNVPSKFDSSNPNVPMSFTSTILQAIKEGNNISDEFITAEQIFDRARELSLKKHLPTPYKLATKDGAKISFVKNVNYSKKNITDSVKHHNWKNISYISPLTYGIIRFDYSNNNGRYVIGQNNFTFELKFSKASRRSIHLYNDPVSIKTVAIAKEFSIFEEITDARIYNGSSRTRTPKVGEITVIQNKNGYYAAIKIISIKDDSRGDDYDEIIFEYMIQKDKSYDFSTQL